MTEPAINYFEKKDVDLLIKTFPNMIDDELLKGGCYILKTKGVSIITYDCREDYSSKSHQLRGSGFIFNRQLTHHYSKVATQHIRFAYHGISYNEIQTVYRIKEDELELLCSNIYANQRKLHQMIKTFTTSKRADSENRFFCSPDLDVIVNVKPNGYELNPTWCKASAAYDAEEELSLISPHSTGYTWWYYPGRMYFSRITWNEISEKDYNTAKQHILDKEQEIYNMINTLAGDRLIE